MLNNEQFNVNKTLTDIIDPDKLKIKAILHWSQMTKKKKKQKGFIYNKVVQNKWNIREELNWVNEYHQLNEFQKRMLLKKELINAYDELSNDDRKLFNDYLDISLNKMKWVCLDNEEKKKIFKLLFKIF